MRAGDNERIGSSGINGNRGHNVHNSDSGTDFGYEEGVWSVLALDALGPIGIYSGDVEVVSLRGTALFRPFDWKAGPGRKVFIGVPGEVRVEVSDGSVSGKPTCRRTSRVGSFPVFLGSVWSGGSTGPLGIRRSLGRDDFRAQ